MDAPQSAPEAGGPNTERPGGPATAAARSTLRVLALLQDRPDGARAEQIAAAIGTTSQVAGALLRALRDEGFATCDDHGVHRAELRLPAGMEAARPAAARELSLAALADELFARTHKRSYIGVLDGGAIEIVEVRGRQGLPRLPGMGDRISDAAHASAMGKVVLSLMRDVAVDRYVARGLKVVGPATITDPAVLRAQLAQAHVDGFATDVEELAADFCCVAAPVFAQDGGLRAVAGISMSCRAFEESLEVLSRAVREVAGTKLTIPGGAPARPATAAGGTPPRSAPAMTSATSQRLAPARPENRRSAPAAGRRVPSMAGETRVS
jgi:acetyl-CoA synthetase